MRNKKSMYMLLLMIVAPLLLTLLICGNQLITATEQIAAEQTARIEKQNAEIEKALGR